MKKIVLIAGLIGFITQLHAQKINIPQGLTFESRTAANMDMEVMGQKVTMVSNSIITANTKEASDTGFVFVNTIKKMMFQMDGMGQQINFDSDRKEDMEGPVGSRMKKVIGSVQEVGVNRNGKVTHLSGSNEIDDKLAEAMNLAGKIIVGTPYYLLIPQTKQHIKVGESWADSTNVSAELMRTVSNYTLKSITPTDITIAHNTILTLNSPIEQQGMTINMNIQGTMKGESVYDKATGLLRTSNSLYDMGGKMEVMGQSMPLILKGTTTLTVSK